MNTNTDRSFAPAEFSFVRGGPFYQSQLFLRLISQSQWSLGRRIIFLFAVGWMPLLLITALLNPGGLLSLLTDYRVHSRMLIAAPALLLGEPLMELSFRTILTQIREANLLDGPDRTYMEGVAANLTRVRDSVLPELVILVLVILHTAASYKAFVDATPWLGQAFGADIHLSPAGWYMILVSAPLFQLLLGLSLWKWLLWTFYAFKLSRRNLKLVATHPDGHGGLGFLGQSSAAFAPVALAATTVVGATWRHEILHQGAHLLDFKLPAIALVAIVALVALGPLVFFVPRLVALRRSGILEYGVLGQIQSTEFHEKWVLHHPGRAVEFLETSDSGNLTDFGEDYERIKQLNPFPADRSALYAMAAAIVIPSAPVVLAQIPLAVVLQDLFRALG